MQGVSLARLGRQETCQITRLGWQRQIPIWQCSSVGQSAYYKSAQIYAGQQFSFCMWSTRSQVRVLPLPPIFGKLLWEEILLEKILACDALMKFIQENCQKCKDAHCFGPACEEGFQKCEARKEREMLIKSVKQGSLPPLKKSHLIFYKKSDIIYL